MRPHRSEVREAGKPMSLTLAYNVVCLGSRAAANLRIHGRIFAQCELAGEPITGGKQSRCALDVGYVREVRQYNEIVGVSRVIRKHYDRMAAFDG